MKNNIIVGVVGFFGLTLTVAIVLAATGDLLATVDLPGNGECNVGIAFDGTHVMTIDAGFGTGCASSTIDIYTPPPASGAAALVSTKTVKDGAGAPVSLSAIDWDATRGKLWGAYAGSVYLVDIVGTGIGVTEDVVATLEFNPAVGGIPLIDGLAWDPNDDTLYYSPDVDCNVYQFSLGTGVNPPKGTLMNTVTPKDAAGNADCAVSGVAIGAANSLYIGRDGNAEIRRVNKTTGAFVSTFATTSGRVEDLVCDPVTYAPKEAILAKDAYGSGGIGGGAGDELYEAFEVEVGTCPLPAPEEITLDPPTATNDAGTDHTVTATITQGGQPVVGTLVSFSVTAGPNVGEVSDPGECSVDPNCNTDANGQTSWTYTSNGSTGVDIIEACFSDTTGKEQCARAEKEWIDATPPEAACVETVNPAGKQKPQAPGTGQNEDGFYEVSATDNVGVASFSVVDMGADNILGTADDTVFVVASGDKMKYTEANGATPSIKPGAGVIDWQIKGQGDAAVVAVDAAGNQSVAECLVPNPPK
ncbi:MAG TPA: hypothetical protein VFE94_03640 [Candidatus Paceibacterota bacterium]|nr:hypothetical protein [Candidatus Paceibacterota bacterium]